MSIKHKGLWESKAYFWMNQCEDYISSWKGFESFRLGLFKLDWSTRRRSSRGGLYGNAPGISIAMALTTKEPGGVARVYEYASFDNDPIIGGFYYTDPEYKLAMHICHEMAHAVQFYSHYILNLKNIDRPHGKSFKEPYSLLRKQVLNPKLEKQKELKLEYEKLIKKYK